MLRFTGTRIVNGFRVGFEAFDGADRVVCAVTAEALQDHAGPEMPLLQAYDMLRSRVEATANYKYENEFFEANPPRSILVRSADL